MLKKLYLHTLKTNPTKKYNNEEIKAIKNSKDIIKDKSN